MALSNHRPSGSSAALTPAPFLCATELQDSPKDSSVCLCGTSWPPELGQAGHMCGQSGWLWQAEPWGRFVGLVSVFPAAKFEQVRFFIGKTKHTGWGFSWVV